MARRRYRSRYQYLHRGLHHKRTEFDTVHGRRERAFADAWEKENDMAWMRGTNFGRGLLQDLMMVPKRGAGCTYRLGFMVSGFRRAFTINQRDAVIAATIIQWLGSNCGRCFLEEVLGKCGYKIVKIKEGTP